MKRLATLLVLPVVLFSALACTREADRVVVVTPTEPAVTATQEVLPRSLATAQAQPRATLTSTEGELEARVQAIALGLEDLPPGFTLEYDYAEASDYQTMYIVHYSDAKITGEEFVDGSEMFAVTILIFMFDLETAAQASYDAVSSRSAEQIMATGREQRHWPADLAVEGIRQLAVDAHTIPFPQVGERSVAWETSETFGLDSQELVMVDRGVLFKRGRVLCAIDVTASQRPPSTESLTDLALRQDERIAEGLP